MKAVSQISFSERVLTRLYGPKVTKMQRKQALILDAFAKCLFEKGLADTSYAAVGEIAGMAPSHLGYYFPTWESMLDQCFRYVIATGQEITVEGISAAKNPTASLKAMCDAPFLHLKRFPEHAAVLSAFHLECSRQKTLRSTHRLIRRQGQARIKSLLQKMVADSNLNLQTKIDFDALSVAIQSLIVGYASEWVAGSASQASTATQASLWQAVQSFLSGNLGTPA